jgi:hypothetical protein
MIGRIKNYHQEGFAPIVTVLVVVVTLFVGVVLGNYIVIPGIKKSPVAITPTPATSEAVTTPAPEEDTPTTTNSKGKISGYLIYPSDHIPPQMGVCAESVSNTTIKTCVKQIVDPKFSPTGVGYEMFLDPGEYYVYSVLGDWKAYYNEFVTCGLKADCPSHAKVSVVVTAGSSNDKIYPHDWYETVDPSAGVSPTIPLSPSVTSIPTLTKINPDVLKLIPTATPTLKLIPTIKKINFGF